MAEAPSNEGLPQAEGSRRVGMPQLLEDDLESLAKVIQRRKQLDLPLHLCLMTQLECGRKERRALAKAVDNWMRERGFHFVKHQHAHVVLVQGTFHQSDRDEVFADITDDFPYEGHVTNEAKWDSRELREIVSKRNFKGPSPAHFYTYQR